MLKEQLKLANARASQPPKQVKVSARQAPVKRQRIEPALKHEQLDDFSEYLMDIKPLDLDDGYYELCVCWLSMAWGGWGAQKKGVQPIYTREAGVEGHMRCVSPWCVKM